MLCGKGYLRGADAIKLMNAPGASFTATVTPTAGIDSLSAPSGTSALKVWLVETPIRRLRFFAPAGTTFMTPPSWTAVPYGRKGFITIRKAATRPSIE